MDSESPGGSWKAPAIALVLIVVVAGAALAFTGSQVSGILSTVGASVGPPGEAPAGGEEPAPDGDGEGGEGGGAGDGPIAGPGGPGVATLLDVSRPDLLIIKTGELVVQVADVDVAISAATNTIGGLGGYVSGSSRSGAGEEAAASVTFRIPAAAWDQALVALRSLEGTVLDEHSETDDVTGTVVDLEARIRNLQATEAALAAIMTRAAAIRDVLTVQEELTTVRGEIEQLQSQAGHLREQATMSTLTLHVRRTPAPVVARQEAEFDPGVEAEEAVAHLVSIGQALTKVGIWLGIVWLPILLAAGFAGGLAFLALRRLRRDSEGDPSLPASASGG